MADRPHGAKSVFLNALEVAPGADRQAYLVAACAGDEALRREVEDLLWHERGRGSFLESAAHPGAAPPDEPIGERPGTVIGRYKLLQQIGEGGMGTVFMAEQTQPVRRKVALKVIKPGLDSRQVVARFEAERQALAVMDHMNIARVFDGGTTDAGRPYFVMELVHGVPITTYCDDNRLTLRERLELFVPVCQAVQHAHQKGVIHRDLKPANVLVTLYDGRPVPKVIDFGVAKAVDQPLTDRTLFTQFGAVVGTLEYMSPEQAELSALGVDTRSDVYSLGVLLYELLTGTTPLTRERLQGAAYAEILRLIQEEEPPKPSTRLSGSGVALAAISAHRRTEPVRLTKLVRGELDWIVLRALEKDRTRRYESAGGFAADVERHLGDEPVHACPQSAGYRLRKFARKNRAALAVAAAVAAVLVVGIVTSTWQAVRATNAEGLADHHRDRAEGSAVEARLQTAAAVRAKQDADRQRVAVSQNLYVADSRLGLVDWTAGNLSRLSANLHSHVPRAGAADLRGWEWYYLLALCHQDERTLMHHSGAIANVAWSPDGRYLASTGGGGGLRVSDSTSGRVVWAWADGGAPMRAAWSPDSRRLAWGTTFSDNGVYVWEVESGVVKSFRGHTHSVWTVAWTRDGKHLASAGMDQTIRIWDSATGTCVRVLDGIIGYINTVDWHPDGKRLASAGQDGLEGLKVREPFAGGVARPSPPPPVTVSTGPFYCAAWSPSGTQLAATPQLSSSSRCQVYKAADLSLISQWDIHKPLLWVAWRPDGGRLATAGADNLIRLWDPADGTGGQVLRGHLDQVTSVAWAPDGRRLVSGGTDGLVKVWPVPATPSSLHLAGHAGGVRAIAWAESGDTLRSLGSEDGTVAHWDGVSGECLGKVSIPGGQGGQFSPGAKLLAVATSSETQVDVVIHEAGTGKRVQALKQDPVPAVNANWPPPLAAFSPDASKLALSNSATLDVTDLRQNEPLFRWHGIRNCGLAWSPDGRHVAVVGVGEPTGDSAMWSGHVYVFDIETRQRVLKALIGTNNVLAMAVAWSPDGRRLATGDQNGRGVIWELSSARMVASAQLQAAEIHALAWSPDGRRVAAGSANGTVCIWSPAQGEELMKLEFPGGHVTLVAWSPNGRRLAAATRTGGIHIWDATAGYEFVGKEAYSFERIGNDLSRAMQLWDTGRTDEAVAVYEQTLEDHKDELAAVPPWVEKCVLDRVSAAVGAGRVQETVALCQLLVRPNPARVPYARLAQHCVGLGRFGDAIVAYREALRLQPDKHAALNNLAWLLATCPDPHFRDAGQAVAAAKKAVELRPSSELYPNTLGVAYYRAGDWTAATAALEKSIRVRRGGDAFDWFFLAMAHWRLGHEPDARGWYDRAVQWMEKEMPEDEELRRFRTEAAELLGITDRSKSEKPPPP